MVRWSLDLDWCTSRLETPVREAETHKAKCQFFSALEVTFTLAANETKQQRVIKADVFIQGFYRKLISWGMQSCAKRIEGSWHSCRKAVASESFRICIYTQDFQFKLFMFFFLFKHWKKWGCGLAHWTARWINLTKLKNNCSVYLSCSNWMIKATLKWNKITMFDQWLILVLRDK